MRSWPSSVLTVAAHADFAISMGSPVMDPERSMTRTMATPGVKFTGRLLVLTLDDAGELVELFMDGQYLEYEDLIIRGEGRLEGKVERVEPGKCIAEVGMGDWVKPRLLVGKRVFFRNARRSSSFRIEEASGSNGVLSLRLESDGKLGRFGR